MITAAAAPLRRVSPVALAGLFAFVAGMLRADSVTMPNGETLQGTIVQETADQVVFRSVSFGEIKIRRAPGMTVARSAAAAPVAAAPAAAAPMTAAAAGVATATASPSAGGEAPPPSTVKQFLGLSDRWSLGLEANLLAQNAAFHATAAGAEFTIGYRVPNETKPTQPRHEYGFFSAYNFQKVNGNVVDRNTEVAFRYFYQPLSSWLLVSQADWMVDRPNGIASRAHVLAIPSYRIIDTPKTRLLTGIGPSYLRDTRLIPTGPRTTTEKSDDGFRAGFYELFLQTISPALKFRQTLVILARPSDPSSIYNLRFEASLRRQITAHLSLNLAYDYLRDENTVFPRESIGTFKLMLGYQF